MSAQVAHWGGKNGGANVVVGASAWNGLAFGTYRTWAFRRAELTPFVESPFRCANGSRATLAHIRTLPPKAFGAERTSAIARRTLEPLLPMLSGLGQGGRVALALALPERLAGRDAEDRRERGEIERVLTALLEKQGARVSLVTEARGHAALAYALMPVLASLSRREVNAAVIGGIDSYYHPRVIEDLIRAERLFDGENLDSVLPGEGGAFLLVTRRDVAKWAGWKTLASVESVATAEETGTAAQALTQTTVPMTQRLRDERRFLDWWLSDVNAEGHRVQEFQLAWPRAASLAMKPESALEFLCPSFGDLGAASLPTAACIAVEGFQRGSPSASNCLMTASSDGPSRGALLLGRGETPAG